MMGQHPLLNRVQSEPWPQTRLQGLKCWVLRTCHLSNILGTPQSVHELVQEIGRKLCSLYAGQQVIPQLQALGILLPSQLRLCLCMSRHSCSRSCKQFCLQAVSSVGDGGRLVMYGDASADL